MSCLDSEKSRNKENVLWKLQKKLLKNHNSAFEESQKWIEDVHDKLCQQYDLLVLCQKMPKISEKEEMIAERETEVGVL